MAELYLAADTTRDHAEVVIKRILPYLSHEPDFVQMFLDEARIASQLRHPNVIRVHELGSLEGSIFIAMEFVDGVDLRKILNETQKQTGTPLLPYGLAALVVSQVAAGLHYAHTSVGVDGRPLQVIHRDVSPQNVMVAYDGRVKLVDFGIAKAGALMERSKPGVIKGKFLYLAPEQLTSERLDARADLFALGTLLYELTTGKSPFQRPSTEAIIYAIRGEEAEAPERHRADYPRELSRIIARCLQKDRTRRYQTGEEIQRDLEAFLQRLPQRPTAQLLARHVAALFEPEDERTVMHLPPPGEPEPTRNLVPAKPAPPVPAPKSGPPLQGAQFEDDDDVRTQAVKPSDLQAAIAGRPPSLVAIPVRRATSTELPSTSMAAPEPTMPLRTAAPPPPPVGDEGEDTQHSGIGREPEFELEATSPSLAKPKPPVPTPATDFDAAPPTARLRPPVPTPATDFDVAPPTAKQRGVAAAPSGLLSFDPEPTSRLAPPVEDSVSATPDVRGRRAPQEPSLYGGLRPRSFRAPPPIDDDLGGRSVSVTEDGEPTANLESFRRRRAVNERRPVWPGVALGLFVLVLLGLLAALLWPKAPVLPSTAPASRPAPAAAIVSPGREASDSPEPARAAVASASAPDAAAAGPTRVGVLFEAPRGTSIFHGAVALEPNAQLLLAPGSFALSYRCPGRRQRSISKTVQISATADQVQRFALGCRSR